jgi:hypothetical protein
MVFERIAAAPRWPLVLGALIALLTLAILKPPLERGGWTLLLSAVALVLASSLQRSHRKVR